MTPTPDQYSVETVSVAANFQRAYTTLLHIEAHLIANILDPRTRFNDIIVEHNILEEAKGRVVQDYLPFSVRTNVVTRSGN